MTTRAEEERALNMTRDILARWHMEGFQNHSGMRAIVSVLLRHYPTESTIRSLYARPEYRDRIDTDEDPPLPGGVEGALPR